MLGSANGVGVAVVSVAGTYADTRKALVQTHRRRMKQLSIRLLFNCTVVFATAVRKLIADICAKVGTALMVERNAFFDSELHHGAFSRNCQYDFSPRCTKAVLYDGRNDTPR